MTTTETGAVFPPEPESLEQTGLPASLIQQLIVKILYFRGDLYGQDLCRAIGLKFSVIQDIIESLILQHYIQVKKSLGMGHVAALMTLTESGRARAREYLESNQYAGPAPVPLAQYAEIVRQQRPRDGWLTKEALRKAFSGMVMTERTLSQVGPAVSSANSLLIYGKPGDGKTYLVESLNNIEGNPVFVPHAIECQGNIVQVFDPIYHQPIEEEEEPSVLAVAVESSRRDRRWIQCKRPFIVSGGELSLDMLDLRFNETSKIYEAPFQLKANNGIYLIDDFGRQRATPAEVLNRWIVPMERRVDYLSFLTGGKMTAPFETFLVFSTNLNPASLGDEAFLRRIQYKLLLRGPGEAEFKRIFENFCSSRRIHCPIGLVDRLIEKHYRRSGKQFRRCHPRDLLSHALNLIHFERLPYELNDEILDRAYESCFVQEDESEPAIETRIVSQAPRRQCAAYWGDQISQISTAFGTLYFLASFRSSASGQYEHAASAQEFGAEETARVLARQHVQAFREWLNLNLTQQVRDLRCYVASTHRWAQIAADRTRLIQQLIPGGASAAEAELFANDFGTVLDSLTPELVAPEIIEEPAPVPMQRIA
jgi:hypothetical protein